MTQPDRLTNVEVNIYTQWEGPEGYIVSKLAKQLADTMRENEENCRIIGMSGERELALRAENERLRTALEEIYRFPEEGNALYISRKALSNKDSEHG